MKIKIYPEIYHWLLPYFFPLQAIGEFVLTNQHIEIKDRGKIFSINEGYAQYWDDAVKEYVHEKKFPEVSQ